MGGFLILIGILGMIGSVIWLIVAAVRKRRKRNPVIALIVSFILVCVGNYEPYIPYDEGMKAYKVHNYKSAVEDLKKVPEKDAEEYEKAQEALKNIPIEAFEYYYTQASEAWEEGDQTTAKYYLEKALEWDPENKEAKAMLYEYYFTQASEALKDENLDEARTNLEKALEWNTENEKVKALLVSVEKRIALRDAGVNAELGIKYYKEAILTTDFTRAIECLKKVPKGYKNYAKVQEFLRKCKEAIVIKEVGNIYYATGDINVRSGPGTKYHRIDKLELGNRINTIRGIEVEKGWIRILCGEKENEIGYVHKSSLAQNKEEIELVKERNKNAIGLAKRIVEKKLVAPATATYPSCEIVSRKGAQYVVYIAVDSQNRLGVTVRGRYLVAFEYKQNDSENILYNTSHAVQKCSSPPLEYEIEFTKSLNFQ
ncbi:hypothetical protein CH333_03090 [candidate division WOR-3 bacterium JGI_Cruoil_03_44_89]|uniref:SH3b domain-containing protein n=1 Tax=candidate division WOR-3 bacterium JGI_Cruoil_03_44_89 TaxID=1973748 RepID=A0A235BWF9_UNCW3|nr:MAG: hypothetical protein CH333_03090 [candidate division WOR-3 bacterium JGI_Cruoil_03_44_89]